MFLFGLTRAPAAQPRALMGGHLGGAAIGILCYQALGDAAWVSVLAVGLTLVFGVLRILNVAHGGLYAFGAFTATTLALWLLDAEANPYLTYLMLLLAALIVGLISYFGA